MASSHHEIAPGLRVWRFGTQEMRVEREFAAPPGAVFELSTTPSLIERWWPPEGVTAVVEELELEPGGAWSMAVDQGGGRSRLFGVYCDVNPPWGYVQSFESEDAGHLWVEAVSLRPHEGGTLMASVGIMASAEARDRASDPGGFEGLRLGHERMKAALA